MGGYGRRSSRGPRREGARERWVVLLVERRTEDPCWNEIVRS